MTIITAESVASQFAAQRNLTFDESEVVIGWSIGVFGDGEISAETAADLPRLLLTSFDWS
ncbi:UNVERIFIED_ORG: hypothetical protein FNL38_104424 [Nocardia globerula]|uniref:Uncharacterized protein n=1 Tax=Nocardia globerula TaxID=1818 RepID=A0A652YPK7_NOCGL|nr:hypothetical protein [Rhodococcus globerulus]NMD62713.1 hypothetical protein [Nocardia globerula]PVX68166.1 hypothetical protein C8E04_5546 [Rhodococcus globerulus]